MRVPLVDAQDVGHVGFEVAVLDVQHGFGVARRAPTPRAPPAPRRAAPPRPRMVRFWRFLCSSESGVAGAERLLELLELDAVRAEGLEVADHVVVEPRDDRDHAPSPWSRPTTMPSVGEPRAQLVLADGDQREAHVLPKPRRKTSR